MPKHLKSEHLNDEIGQGERALNNATPEEAVKIGVKILILTAKLIRDIRHNQVSIMKKMGVKLTASKKAQNTHENEN